MRLNRTENNFDFLRILAALLVLVSHQFALTGRNQPAIVQSLDLGNFGVLIFFCISGYLVTQSWLRDPNPWRFAAKRFLRIWPGLTAVTLLAALILGPLVSTFTLADYFSSPDTLKYFLQLKLNIKNILPGVFSGNPVGTIVNGSLWTIPLEVHWYFILLLTGVFGILRRKYLALACAVAFIAYYFSGLGSYADGSPKQKNTLGLFFIVGACLYLFEKVWMVRRRLALIAVVSLAIVFGMLGQTVLAQITLIPFAVILVGSASTPVLRRFGRFGDLSYGIYIYAFPVQQTVVWISGNGLSFNQGLVVSALITTVFAYFSWHLIERPSLHLKRRFSNAKATPGSQVSSTA